MLFLNNVRYWLLVGLFAGTLIQAQAKTIVVSIVSDGVSPWATEVVTELELQLRQLGGSELIYQFPAEYQYDSEWRYDQAASNIELALAQRDVDIVIALGLLSSDAATNFKPKKPLIATSIVDTQAQGLTISETGTSTQQNFHFLATNVDISSELKRFQRAIGANNIGILTDAVVFKSLPFLQQKLTATESFIDFTITPIQPVAAEMQSLAASLPVSIDGLFVLPQLRLSDVDNNKLIRALKNENIATFTMQGRTMVEQGYLMGTALIPSYLQLARRLAVDMRDIALGRSISELAVALDVKDRFVMNMETARQINYEPPFTLMVEADLLNEEPAEGRVLSLFEAVDESIKRNLRLAIANEDLLTARQDTRIARSNLLPQLNANANWDAQDRDLVGTGPNRTTALSLSLSQSIYSESNYSNYTSSQYLEQAQAANLNATRLDVIQSTAQAYLNVLISKTQKDIQQDNLKLTVANLERAQFRYEVGSTDRSEVLRFETELGNGRQSVTNAQRDYQKALNNLNQLLHRPISEPFQTQEPGLTGPKIFGDERLELFLSNNRQLRIFSGFLTQKSFENSPELLALKNEILSQERLLLAANRKRYVPDVDLTGNINRVIDDSGAQFPTEYDNDWSVGLQFSWTLYQGSRIRAEQSREELSLRRLKLLYKQTADDIETNTRNSIAQAGASKINIDYGEAAATAAQKTLDLVTDSYVRGRSSYIDLIDAQSAYLTARLAAADNVYDHLLDLIDIQRAIGFFDFYVSPAEENSWFEELNEFARTYRKN